MKLLVITLCVGIGCVGISENKALKTPQNPEIVFIQDTTFLVCIDNSDLGQAVPCDDSIVRHLYKEFHCQYPDATYVIDIIEDSTALLKLRDSVNWLVIDTLSTEISLFEDMDCTIGYPKFTVTDFNQDGYQDLLCCLLTNVNGNLWGKLFLYDPEIHHLVLVPSAEDNGIWAAPEFNPKTKQIESVQVSGVYGLSYESQYKLEGAAAKPFKKKETDTRGVGLDGKGGVERIYRGVGGNWNLIKERANR